MIVLAGANTFVSLIYHLRSFSLLFIMFKLLRIIYSTLIIGRQP